MLVRSSYASNGMLATLFPFVFDAKAAVVEGLAVLFTRTYLLDGLKNRGMCGHVVQMSVVLV